MAGRKQLLKDILKLYRNLELDGICYVLLRTKKAHQIYYSRDKFIWYPEDGMSLLEIIKYIPYVKSVVTESPWIISCYDRKNVRVWNSEDLCWEKPYFRTYGASVNNIMMGLFGIVQTIPSFVLDGGIAIDKLISELNYGE